MTEDQLVIVFVVIMAICIIIYFVAMKKNVGKMPKAIQERYEGKIKAECKSKTCYGFVTDDAFVIQCSNGAWWEFPFENMAYISGGVNKMKMSGYSMNVGNLYIYDENRKLTKGKIVTTKKGRAVKASFTFSNGEETQLFKDFLFEHVPGLQEKV